jgi:hypothetical protein
MAAEIDLDRLSADWSDGEDPLRATAEAKSQLLRVREGKVDVVAGLRTLEQLIEPACDGPGGDPLLAFQAFYQAEPAFRRAEDADAGLHTDRRLELRSRTQLLIARAGYRAGYDRPSFVRIYSLLRWIEEFVEGRSSLLGALESPAPDRSQVHGLRPQTPDRLYALGSAGRPAGHLRALARDGEPVALRPRRQ